MKRTIYISLMIILLFSKCTPGRGYRAFHDFPEKVWNRFENPVINFDISDPGIYYDMLLELNYVPSPDLQNFTITVIMTTPSGEVRSRDLEIDFNRNEGVSGPGKLRFVLRKEYAFSDKGKCSFEIESRSPRVTTPGFKSIGIIMEKTQ